MVKKNTGKQRVVSQKNERENNFSKVIAPKEIEEKIEKNNSSEFPVVGIGASAGGLAAFEEFFSGMPVDAEMGMAFVIVQHLAPDHESILTDLVKRYTRMKVFEVEDGMVVRPNCAYIIPPNRDMAFMNGSLQLLEPTAPRGQRLPIDFFFRSLAQDRHEKAIGIILSGTGSDGTLGMRDIKNEGGMVIAQKPESTEYDGMPRSAIATGLVDYILLPSEMAGALISFVTHIFNKHIPAVGIPATKSENALKKIFILLRAQTGHDFSQYKPSTIHRRIDRRIAVQQIESLEDYAKYLQQSHEEVESLFRDLLIGVTSFFRDAEAFSELDAKVIPQLFEGKPAGGVVRVWIPGCATGEEAYSIAILLQERLEALKQSYKLQVFATDIDSQSIVTARAGIYSASIANDISSERLARYFTLEPDGITYRIHKGIRDLLIFSEQDVIKDPPFSKVDLVSCRNLLIYMGSELQKKVIPLFHYSLNKGGFLFLGTSETVGEFTDLFSVMDRKLKIYQRKDIFLGAQRTPLSRYLPPMISMDVMHPQNTVKPMNRGKLSLRELTEQTLLQHSSLVGALVNDRGDILYLHGRTGLYLELAPGEAGVNNILKMARDGLKRELTTSLHKAVATKEVVQCSSLQIKTSIEDVSVSFTIQPVVNDIEHETGSGTSLYLVILEKTSGPNYNKIIHTDSIIEKADGDDSAAMDANERIATLKRELLAKEEYLQTTNEELETTNEELKSSNEEMQSVNEELQSTNEELETSKEELQSVNEELATVNAELQTKVADLSRANNDMNNLLAGTGIATVFVDHTLCILRFTPAATRIINLILTDVGRPVGHIVSNLIGYDSLSADVQNVLDTLVPKELEVQTKDARWYTMRIRPYRTLDNVIEGAVITFFDITETKKTSEELNRNEILLRTTQQLIHVGSWEWNVLNRTMFWTDELYRLYDIDTEDFLSSHKDLSAIALDCYLPEDRKKVQNLLKMCIDEGKSYDMEFCIVTTKGRKIWIRSFAEPVFENEKVVRVIGTIIDITEKHAQDNNEIKS